MEDGRVASSGIERPERLGAGRRTYSAYGLRFRSELPLPFRAAPGAGPADVVVRRGAVPRALEGCAPTGLLWQADRDAFLLDVEGIARYLVRGGREITVEPADAGEDGVAAFLLGSVLAACLQQRGILTLHASAMEVGDGAVLFAGVSGAGKSTLAAALLERGHRMLADDVTGVVIEGGGPKALSAFPALRLWADVLECMDWRAGGDTRVRADLDKHVVAVDRFCPSPLPVRAVFALDTHNRDAVAVEAVPRGAAFEVLLRRTYRMRYVGAMGRRREHFGAVAALARAAPLFRVVRPDWPLAPDAAADAIERRLGAAPAAKVADRRCAALADGEGRA